VAQSYWQIPFDMDHIFAPLDMNTHDPIFLVPQLPHYDSAISSVGPIDLSTDMLHEENIPQRSSCTNPLCTCSQRL